jgi:hypothetical protein
VLIGFPSGHTSARDDAAVRRRAASIARRAAAASIIEGVGRSAMTQDSPDRHLRHGDGDARRDAEAQGLDVQGSDQDVYPPMSDFLARRDPTLAATAEHITGDLDLVVVGNAISRGNPELEEVLDRKIRTARCPKRSANTSLGRALDRHRRHARQDDDDIADGMGC